MVQTVHLHKVNIEQEDDRWGRPFTVFVSFSSGTPLTWRLVILGDPSGTEDDRELAAMDTVPGRQEQRLVGNPARPSHHDLCGLTLTCYRADEPVVQVGWMLATKGCRRPGTPCIVSYER